MPSLFVDPDGHTRPYSIWELSLPGLADTRVRRVFALVFTVLLVLTVAVGAGTIVSRELDPFLLAMTFGYCVVCFTVFVCALAEMRRIANSDIGRLGATETGRALLEEGAKLRERREHLVKGSSGTFPLLMAFLVPEQRGGDTDEYEHVACRIWTHHLALEHNLRDRQERHLRGEGVGTVGHLSSI